MERKNYSPAFKIALIYFLIGSFWILLSDQLVAFLYPTEEYIFRINISKGLVFVLLTTLVLYFTSKKYIQVIKTEKHGKELKETELKISEEKYRLIFDNNPMPLWVYEMDSLRIIDVNKAAIDKYGFAKEEFLNMTIIDIRPKDEQLRLIEYFKTSNTNLDDSLIWKHKIKNGDIIYVQVSSRPIKFDGKSCRIVLANDITELLQSEKALKESEQKYKRIFENIVDVYYEATVSGTILEISPSISILTNGEYKREDLIGKSIIEFYVDENQRSNYLQQLIKHKRVDDYEICLKTKKPRIFYCSLTAKLLDEGTPFERIVGSIRDVTVRREYEEDLIKAKEDAEKADRLKSEFLAQMSHEIRTPLNIILNSTQFIQEELDENLKKELHDIFVILKSSGKRIIRTIDSILNMAELQTGSYEPEFGEFCLEKNVLSELIDEYKILAKEKKLTLDLIVETDETLIHADRYSVNQIFANLIDNAIKYTKQGGIKVRLYEDKKTLRVEVKDTGIGISPEFLPHLFEAFRQEQQGYSRKFEGNGLGLALVDKFCRINNAEITVQSSKNTGSIFTVSFIKNKEY